MIHAYSLNKAFVNLGTCMDNSWSRDQSIIHAPGMSHNPWLSMDYVWIVHGYSEQCVQMYPPQKNMARTFKEIGRHQANDENAIVHPLARTERNGVWNPQDVFAPLAKTPTKVKSILTNRDSAKATATKMWSGHVCKGLLFMNMGNWRWHCFWNGW